MEGWEEKEEKSNFQKHRVNLCLKMSCSYTMPDIYTLFSIQLTIKFYYQPRDDEAHSIQYLSSMYDVQVLYT